MGERGKMDSRRRGEAGGERELEEELQRRRSSGGGCSRTWQGKRNRVRGGEDGRLFIGFGGRFAEEEEKEDTATAVAWGGG
uniref:Uncharacterized protein n=1 Tax=Oryza glumipatula TaxID=40148 RepID=A0A0D9YQL0_9ORYZ